MNLGVVARALGGADNAALALHCAEAAVAIHPDSADAHVNAGVVYRELSGVDRAEESYRYVFL